MIIINFIKDNYIKILCILCYISFLVLIPYIREKNNKLIVFHLKEGFNLFIYELITLFILDTLGISSTLAIIFYVILSLVGIKNVIDSNNEILPIIGKYRIVK